MRELEKRLKRKATVLGVWLFCFAFPLSASAQAFDRYQTIAADFQGSPYFQNKNLNHYRSGGLSGFLKNCTGCFSDSYANEVHLSDTALVRLAEFQIFSEEAFSKALEWHAELTTQNKLQNSRMLTLVDFSLPSNVRRLWLIDLELNKVLVNTFVSHGSGSGTELVATQFSNQIDTKQSSLGAMITGQSIQPSRNFVTKLSVIGLEKGINDNATERGILFHRMGFGTLEVASRGFSMPSAGCFGLPYYESGRAFGLADRSVSDLIMEKIQGHSLVYVVGPK